MLSLNNLCKEYGVLPSVAAPIASTFDLLVLDLATKYQVKLHKDAKREQELEGMPSSERAGTLSQEDMAAMMERVNASS